MKRLLFLVAAVLAPLAHAGVALSQFPPNPGVLPGGGWQFNSGTTFADPPPPRAWVNGVYQGVPSATAVDSLTLSGRAGALAVQARTTVTAAEVALGLARVAGNVALPLAIGSLAYELLKGAGVRQGSSGAEMDFGTDPDTKNRLQYFFPGASGEENWSTSVGSACKSAISTYNAAVHDGRSWSYKSSSQNPLVCVFEVTDSSVTYQDGSHPKYGGQWTGASRTSMATGCPEIIDSLTGQSYVPGTYSDGKCITGRYESATESQVSSRIAPFVNSSPSNAAKAVVQSGGSINSSEFTTTGPASQIGSPTSSTTTAPTGTTTTTTTPTYNYTYSGDKITYSTTNTTTTNTCTGAGSCSTTSTSTTPSPSTPQDPNDPCTANPDRIGCGKLGEVPDAPITPVQKSITVAEESVSLPSGCPADIALPGGRVISYATACDSAQKMAPLVIAAGVLSALLIAVAAIRSN